MISDQRADAVRARARRVLDGNWREGHLPDGTAYGFSCPSAFRYRHQWYWDSCFHAIVWRHFDKGRAREELRTLLRSGRLDGFIPHTAFWQEKAGWRRAPFYATQSLRGDSGTAHIQTPLIALAWELVAESSDDYPEFATESIAALRLHYDWLHEHRDPDGDGLISIIHPDESGLDDSPKYDEVFGWMSHYRPGYFWLVERSRRLGYDSREIIERYDEHIEDVMVNVFYALSLRSLSRLSGDRVYEERAELAERSLYEKSWDEERGLYFDLVGRSERRLEVSTWSSLAPLALPTIPEEHARRLIEEHILDPRRYHAPVGIPSVSMEEPSFRPGFHLARCWRGPSWVNIAWLLAPALERFGYEEEAERVVDSLIGAVEGHGYREYFNPLDGDGLAARRFGWSTLLVDLLERRAARPAGELVTTANGYSPGDLPSVAEHAIEVAAPPERAWEALTQTIEASLRIPGAATAAKVLGADVSEARGDPLSEGSTLPGFEVVHSEAPVLALAGQHHFSRYEIIFRVEGLGNGRSRVTSETLAAFPRPHGRVYRALVVGTGLEAVAARRVLGAVRKRGEGAVD